MHNNSVILINPASSPKPLKKLSLYNFATSCIPLGIAYLGSTLLKNNIRVSVIDQQAEKIANTELIDILKKRRPKIIGFSCLTYAMPNISNLINSILQSKLCEYIVLGNVHADFFTKQILEQWPEKVIVIHKEAELTMRDLAISILNKKDISNVMGISFFRENKLFNTQPRSNIDDLDQLPYPAFELFNLKLYKNKLALLNSNAPVELPVLGSRGCPYECIFCAQKFIHVKPRYRKESEIIKEIEYMIDKFGASHFGFYDAYFPFNKKSTIEFCHSFIKKNLHKKIGWDSALHPKMADKELLKLMHTAGAKRIFFGFESGNETILKNAKKPIDLNTSLNAIQLAKQARLSTVGLFMLGLPGETKKTCRQTINFAKKLDCDVIKFCFFIPFPGSESFSIIKDKVINNPLHWAVYEKHRPYTPASLSEQDLNILHWQSLFEFYARPKKILQIIKKGFLKPKPFFLMSKTMLTRIYRLISFKKKLNKPSNKPSA